MTTAMLSLSTNSFCGFFKRTLWHFNQSFGSSRIASSAYQKRPTRSACIQRTSTDKAGGPNPSPFKVWELVEVIFTPSPLIIRFTRHNYNVKKTALLLSWGKLRKEPATRWFDGSFVPFAISEKRFARQQFYEPPSEFLLTLPCTAKVHHLSGLRKGTLMNFKCILNYRECGRVALKRRQGRPPYVIF